MPAARSPVAPASRAGLGDLMLIHGLGGMGSNWNAVRTALADRPVKVTAPDLPGHGTSASDSPGIDDLIAWVVKQLDASDAALHLVGHSLGAHVAVLAAAQRPAKVAALTLLAPAGCGADINGRFVTGMAAATTPGELRHLLRKGIRHPAECIAIHLDPMPLHLRQHRHQRTFHCFVNRRDPVHMQLRLELLP